MTAEPAPYLVDDENPELTDEQIRAMRPASEVRASAILREAVGL